MARSIRNERTAHRACGGSSARADPVILFFTTWVAHAIAEWQVFTDEQLAHGQ